MPAVPGSRNPIVILVVWLIITAGLVALARGLRPDSFFVGDPGVKLVAVRRAIHNPAGPLSIPLPTIAGERVPFVEPFFAVHGDHTHAVTSELFPLLSAPFIAGLGIRGAYVLPALGFLLTIGACVRLARTLDQARDALPVLIVAALATPFLFYGLEFWEHAPALALAALATPPLIERPTTRWRPFVAGFFLGVSTLLRPEALLYGIAVLAASRTLPSRLPLRALAAVAGGVAVAMLPIEAYALLHFGSLVTPHMAGNSPLAVAFQDGWLADRVDLFGLWLIRLTDVNFWRVAPLMALGFVPLARVDRRSGRTFLALVALTDVALVVLTAPNDGGGQWGPRYLLFAYIPLVVLAADRMAATARRGVVGALAAVFVFGVSVSIQRTAYRQLRTTKLTYGTVVDLVRDAVQPGGYAVTDLWWLDQVAAAATADRRILYAADRETRAAVFEKLNSAGVAAVTLLRSRIESRDSTEATPRCYAEYDRAEIAPRGLTAIQLRRSCER